MNPHSTRCPDMIGVHAEGTNGRIILPSASVKKNYQAGTCSVPQQSSGQQVMQLEQVRNATLERQQRMQRLYVSDHTSDVTTTYNNIPPGTKSTNSLEGYHDHWRRVCK